MWPFGFGKRKEIKKSNRIEITVKGPAASGKTTMIERNLVPTLEAAGYKVFVASEGTTEAALDRMGIHVVIRETR